MVGAYISRLNSLQNGFLKSRMSLDHLNGFVFKGVCCDDFFCMQASEFVAENLLDSHPAPFTKRKHGEIGIFGQLEVAILGMLNNGNDATLSCFLIPG